MQSICHGLIMTFLSPTIVNCPMIGFPFTSTFAFPKLAFARSTALATFMVLPITPFTTRSEIFGGWSTDSFFWTHGALRTNSLRSRRALRFCQVSQKVNDLSLPLSFHAFACLLSAGERKQILHLTDCVRFRMMFLAGSSSADHSSSRCRTPSERQPKATAEGKNNGLGVPCPYPDERQKLRAQHAAPLQERQKQ
jgi:hypothetical protein